MKPVALCVGLILVSPTLQAMQWDQLSTKHQQRTTVQTSKKHLNKKYLQVGRNTFRNDCSGYVHMVLYELGHSIDDFYRTYRIETNGVSLIHQYVDRVGQVTTKKKPMIGDIVFFSNTYDVNRDGRANDPLSHIGIIEKIAKDGTITFLHYMNNRVRRGFMNLRNPNKHIQGENIVNTYLRRRNQYTTKTLSAQLFAGFGRLRPK